jgi:hypothetical protein
MADNTKPSLSQLDELLKLHSGTTAALLKKVTDGEATAADLAASVQWLRLNGVYRGGQLSPDELGDALTNVYHNLPRFDDEDPATQTPPLN